MATAATLSVDLKANLAGLEEGFRQASVDVQKLGKDITTSLSSVTGYLDKAANITRALGLEEAASGIQMIGSAATATSAAIGSVGAVGLVGSIGALAAAAGAVVLIYQNWDTVTKGLAQAQDVLAGRVLGVAEAAQRAAEGLTRSLQMIEANEAAANRQQTSRLQEQMRQVQAEVERMQTESMAQARRAAQLLEMLDATSNSTYTAIIRRNEGYRRELEALRGAMGANNEAINNQLAILEVLQQRLQGLNAQSYGPPVPPGLGQGGGAGGAVAQRQSELERFAETVRNFRTEEQRLRDELIMLDDAFNRGLISQQQFEEAQGRNAEAMQRLTQTAQNQQQPLTELQAEILSFGKSFSNSLVGIFFSAEKNFGQALANMAKKLAEFVAYAMIVKPLMNSLFGPGGSLAGFLPNLGGRATGGPVRTGGAYTVGEFGPETFIPSTAGRIVPNGGHGGTVVNVVNNSSNTQTRTEEREDGMGGRSISVFIEDVVRNGLASGRFDSTMSTVYGARRVGRI